MINVNLRNKMENKSEVLKIIEGGLEGNRTKVIAYANLLGGKCNLDIPSCLCVKYTEPDVDNKLLTKAEKIKKATKIFLNCLEENNGK